MSCFPCCAFLTKHQNVDDDEDESPSGQNNTRNSHKPGGSHEHTKNQSSEHINVEGIAAKNFTFREIATATKNFRHECLLGEGGFGRVYKGTLRPSSQAVAVKQLDRNGMQGNKEFLGEVLKLSLLQHPNLVSLVGYCADGDQRVLVYEFMSGGSLEHHLFDIGDKKPLDWYTRIKIATGAAIGLEYLHEKADPPIIYRDLKTSNIMLDKDNKPKLSDFGFAKLGHSNDKMGTYGYSAPEHIRNGEVTLQSDVYCFGVVLLELITGRRVIDTTRPNEEQNLVTWAQTFFRDPTKFPELADPLLEGKYPEKDLNQAVAIAAMCLQEEAPARPFITDVVATLSFLSTKPDPTAFPRATPPPPPSLTTPTPPLPPSDDHEQDQGQHHHHHDGDQDNEVEAFSTDSVNGSSEDRIISQEEQEINRDNSTYEEKEEEEEEDGESTVTSSAIQREEEEDDHKNVYASNKKHENSGDQGSHVDHKPGHEVINNHKRGDDEHEQDHNKNNIEEGDGLDDGNDDHDDDDERRVVSRKKSKKSSKDSVPPSVNDRSKSSKKNAPPPINDREDFKPVTVDFELSHLLSI